MAEELHKVADYYLPNKSVSTRAHSQVAELIHLGPSFSSPPLLSKNQPNNQSLASKIKIFPASKKKKRQAGTF